jgi:hypothetical protein
MTDTLFHVCLCHRSGCNRLFYRTIARSLVSCDNVLCICVHLQPDFWRLFIAVKLEMHLMSCNGAGWTVTKIPITWPWNALYATHCVRSSGVYTFYMFWLPVNGWHGPSGTSFPYYKNTDFLVTSKKIRWGTSDLVKFGPNVTGDMNSP